MRRFRLLSRGRRLILRLGLEGRELHARRILRRRRELPFHDLIDLLLIDGFPLQKRLRHGFHLVAVFLNETAGNSVLLVDDAADFLVNGLHGALGNMRRLRHRTAEEHFALVFRIDHRAHALAHAVAGHHVARELRGALEVV